MSLRDKPTKQEDVNMDKYKVSFLGRKEGAIGRVQAIFLTLEMESKCFVYKAIQEAGYELFRLGKVQEVNDGTS